MFRDVVLANPEYVELVTSEAYTHRTYYMGLVDAANKVTFYDGTLRVVDPGGQEFLTFEPGTTSSTSPSTSNPGPT